MASADYSVGTKVTADVSNFEKGMNKAEKSLKGFSDKLANSIDRLGKKGLIGSMANVTLAVGGLTKSFNTVIKFAKDVGKAINDCTEAYKGQVIAERALDTAIQNNPFISGASSKALKEFASDMQRVTNYGDEQLIPMMTNLVSLGRTEAETMQIMSVAMDMSAGMGISLDSAITQLNATLNGNIGRLGQQNAELKGLTEEELKQGRAIEILGEKFKGLSSATADTSKQLQNIKGDFKEALGQFTLPSSDMWNKFWAGFYEQGIKVLGDINKKINELTIGKTLAGAMTGQLGNLSYTGDRIEYLRDAFTMISDEELDAVTDYLSSLSRVNDEQRQILERAELEKQRRIDIQKIERQMAEDSAKRKKEKEEEAELENGIASLKDKHIQKLKEQEAKWENIKKVTGEDVKLEEKIKFYQDDLVAIMTEAGGQITTNNQYYKDQIKIINELKEKLGLVAETTEDITETTEEALEVWADLSSDLSKGITEVVKNAQKGLYNVQLEIGKAKETVINDFGKTVAESFSQMFTMLGENLVGAGQGFEDFASVALKALSEVLKSISAQLSALAVLKAVTHDYANATIALAGATASMVASGSFSAIANKMGNVNTTLEKFNTISTITIEKVKLLREELSAVVSGLQYTTASSYSEMSALLLKQEQLTTTYNSLVKQREDAWNATPEDMRDWYLRGLNGGLDVDNYAVFKGSGFTYWHQLDKEVKTTAKDLEDIASRISSYYKTILESLKAQNEAITDEISSYKTIYGSLEKVSDYYKIILEEQKTSILNATKNVVQSLTKSGASVGDAIINALINGGTKKDFLSSMKDYIRENLIKLAVYTESFQNQLAEVGVKITSALLTGGDFSAIRSELENLWQVASTNATKAEKIIESVFGDIGKTIENTVIEINAVGESIGNTIFNSILNGAKRSDFLLGMKNFMRENLLKLAVYTDEFKYKLKEIGEKIGDALIGDMTEDVVSGLRTEIETLYDSAIKNARRAENIVSSVFGDIKETVEETLTKFENLMKSFKESISDVGGEIGQTFVDSISNGMSQGDFLDKMKSWIKRMLVQSVVYTESMKSEIEAIGQAITKGIREGFTETSLHEIRRDLSWVFNEANETISSLDNILDRTFGGYAVGTNNALSGLHLVGEAGPELVRFRGGEQVLNASNTQKALSEMGGTTINQNVTFNNLQDTTAYAMMNQFKQYNRQMAINGVI